MQTLAVTFSAVVTLWCGATSCTSDGKAADASADAPAETGAADTESEGADVADAAPDDAWSNPAGCPADDPALNPVGLSSACDAGLACHYPAAGCAPGMKPDNVCQCGANGWQCEGHARNCLPLTDGASLASGTRPKPPHRAAAAACGNTADEPRDASCTSDAACFAGVCGTPANCVDNHDCASDEACLRTLSFAPRYTCRCAASRCLTDDACGARELCECGVVTTGDECVGDHCGTRCVPAECRTDIDCAGGFCSPSFDGCQRQLDGYFCHDPSADECLSDAECARSADGPRCRHVGSQWRCTSQSVCD